MMKPNITYIVFGKITDWKSKFCPIPLVIVKKIIKNALIKGPIKGMMFSKAHKNAITTGFDIPKINKTSE